MYKRQVERGYDGGAPPFGAARMERLRRLFDFYDVNKNGVLEANELFMMLLETGFEKGETEVSP